MTGLKHWQMGLCVVWAMALCLGCKNTPPPEPPEVSEAPSASAVASAEASDVSVTETSPVQSPRVYPKDLEFGGDLDIIVIQGRKALTLTNRTTRTYENIELWVNQRYAAHVGHIDIGTGTTVALESLINRYGESYPVPGFLRPDRSFPALLVEIVDLEQSKRFRLHVRSKP